MKTLVSLAVLALALSITSHATDAYNFKSLGFSDNGRYFAFTQSVIQDGSGYASSRGYIVDVTLNTIVQSERVLIENEYASEKEALRQTVRRLALKKYGINEATTGQTLWTRLPTDLDLTTKANFSLDYLVNGGASSLMPKFTLNVSEIDAGNTGTITCYDGPSSMIEVTLEKFGDTKSGMFVLQKDSYQPKSRECSSHYTISHVIEFKGAIVTILRYQVPGFEGPDYQFMAITAPGVLTH